MGSMTAQESGPKKEVQVVKSVLAEFEAALDRALDQSLTHSTLVNISDFDLVSEEDR